MSNELTEAERDDIAAACDAAFDFGGTWIRFLRNGNESMLLPVVERIIADRLAADLGRYRRLRERMEALSDEWGWIKDEDESPTRYEMWRAFRAALSPDPDADR